MTLPLQITAAIRRHTRHDEVLFDLPVTNPRVHPAAFGVQVAPSGGVKWQDVHDEWHLLDTDSLEGINMARGILKRLEGLERAVASPKMEEWL